MWCVYLGFILVEIMVVLFIVVIVLGIGVFLFKLLIEWICICMLMEDIVEFLWLVCFIVVE